MLTDAGSPDHPLTRVIDQLAHLLPAQGPISIFIHHNTLHAFEHLPFEEAVEHAAIRLGREPFLAESRYRDKLASGRIRPRDVEALLLEQLGASATEDVAGVGSRLDLWRAVVLHGIPDATGRELSWILEETEALSRFRTDVPASARSALIALRELNDRVDDERQAVRRLWNACLEAVRRADTSPVPARGDSGSPSRLAARRARCRHRCLDPSAAHSIPGWLPRSGSRALVHAREGPRDPWLLSGDLPHVAGGAVRPLGPNAPSPRRRRPRRRAERARLDRPLPRLSSVSTMTSASTICAPNCSPCEAGPASCVRSKSGPTVSRHGISRSRCADTSRCACCSNGPRSTRRRDNSPSAGPLSAAPRLASGSAPCRIASDGHRTGVAALSRRTALRPRSVDRRAVDAAARGGARIRAATARRRAPASHPAPGVRASDSSSPVRRAHAPHTARASRAAGVPGDFLHRRAGGIVSPAPGGGRASLRDVQHRRLLQRGDVSRGRDGRSPAAALPCGDSSRPLRRRNRSGRGSPHAAHAASAPAGRRLPRLQRASGKPAADARRGADDGVRLAGARSAGPARGLPMALVTMAPDPADLHSPPAEPACNWIARTRRRPSGSIPGSPCGRWRISSVASLKTSAFAIASRRSCS